MSTTKFIYLFFLATDVNLSIGHGTELQKQVCGTEQRQQQQPKGKKIGVAQRKQ